MGADREALFEVLRTMIVEDRQELRLVRQGLEARQSRLAAIVQGREPEDYEPFPAVSQRVASIRDGDFWWLPSIFTIAIFAKAFFVIAFRAR
jgi:hypothetical protein